MNKVGSFGLRHANNKVKRTVGDWEIVLWLFPHLMHSINQMRGLLCD